MQRRRTLWLAVLILALVSVAPSSVSAATPNPTPPPSSGITPVGTPTPTRSSAQQKPRPGTATPTPGTGSSTKKSGTGTGKPGTSKSGTGKTTTKPGKSKTPTKPGNSKSGQKPGTTAPRKPTTPAKSGRQPAKPGYRQPPARPVAPLVPWGWPKLVSIPRIGVNKVVVEPLSMANPNDLHAPYKWGDVAWYDRGPRPGDVGRAVIWGHLDSDCCPAVFYLLRDLKPGDIVQVTYRSGKTLNFRVMWQTIYWDYQFPTKWVFGRTTERGLVLYTCNGVFHTDGTGYDHKVFVYARLILPNGRLG